MVPNLPPVRHDGDAYGRQLEKLLPPGRAIGGAGSLMAEVCAGAGQELARVDARIGDALDEMDPRTASETLPDWEGVLGLEAAGDEGVRQSAISGKLVSVGGQSREYILGVVAAMGFTATIYETWPDVFRMGSHIGEPLNGIAWVFNYLVEVNLAESEHGVGPYSAAMEAAIQKISPAHVTVGFTYS